MSKATDAPVSGWKKPGRLQAGATVGLIAPASPVSEEKTAKALANLAAQGFRVKEGAAMRARHGYLAGDDNARLADIHWAFSDPEVEAVVHPRRLRHYAPAVAN